MTLDDEQGLELEVAEDDGAPLGEDEVPLRVSLTLYTGGKVVMLR